MHEQDERHLGLSVVLFVELVLLDLSVTVVALTQFGGYYEANILPAYIVDVFGIAGLLVPPLAAVTLVSLYAKGIQRVEHRIASRMAFVPVLGCCTVYAVVVARNAWVIVS